MNIWLIRIVLKLDLCLYWKVFKIKDNVYVTEFEMAALDDGYICMAAALSDSSAIYLYSDSSNVSFSLQTTRKMRYYIYLPLNLDVPWIVSKE